MQKYCIVWREDSFLSKNGNFLKYDKLEHALLAALGMTLSMFFIPFRSFQMFLLLFLIWNSIGITWEFYQLVVKKQLIQPKDIAANNIGIMLTLIFFI